MSTRFSDRFATKIIQRCLKLKMIKRIGSGKTALVFSAQEPTTGKICAVRISMLLMGGLELTNKTFQKEFLWRGIAFSDSVKQEHMVHTQLPENTVGPLLWGFLQDQMCYIWRTPGTLQHAYTDVFKFSTQIVSSRAVFGIKVTRMLTGFTLNELPNNMPTQLPHLLPVLKKFWELGLVHNDLIAGNIMFDHSTNKWFIIDTASTRVTPSKTIRVDNMSELIIWLKQNKHPDYFWFSITALPAYEQLQLLQ
jgi:serine/threonine protein kinase